MKRSVWYIFALFLFLRILFAFQLPVFNDESIYMRWGTGFLAHPERWWAFMGDGKQPAVAIVFGLAQLIPMEPIIAMRLVSILFSCITFWTTYLLLMRFSKSTNYQLPITNYGLLLLAFSPFLIVYDSLALAESAVTACMTVAIFLSLSFSSRPRVWKGAMIGLVIAAGWWFKSSILLAVPMVIMTLAFSWRAWIKQWSIVIFGLCSAFIIGIGLVSPVLFNPNSAYADTMAAIPRLLTIEQVLEFPLMRWWINFEAVGEWFIGFGTPLLCILFFIAWYINRKQKHISILALWVVVPVLFEILFVASLAARLFAYAMVPLVVVASFELSRMKSRILSGFVVVSIMVFGCLMAISPTSYYSLLAPIPAAQGDLSQYVSGWTSGYGIPETLQYLDTEYAQKNIVVFVRMDSGNPEDAIIAAMERKHIPVFYISQVNDIAQVKELAELPWYFVSRGPQYAGIFNYLTEVAKYKKPFGDEFVGVYRINK